MSVADNQRFVNSTTPLDEKWRLFEPYYARIQDGSYCRAAQLAMARFYEMERLTSLEDAIAVTERVQAANQPGLYRRVLKDACHIRLSMNYGDIDDDPAFFAPVIFASSFSVVTRARIREMGGRRYGISCSTLARYVDTLRRYFTEMHARGMKGIKFHLAYERDLHFPRKNQAEAEGVYNRVLEEEYGWRPQGLGYEESGRCRITWCHRMIEIAGDLQVPVVFHSALQASMEHNGDDARPLRLWNLPNRYRRVDFIVLHAGLPWMEDAALLAKHFPQRLPQPGMDASDVAGDHHPRAVKLHRPAADA